MIACEKLHNAFILKANHSNSNYLKRLSTAQRDIYLNEAKDVVFESLVKTPEIDPEVRNHLRQIERKNVCVECIDKGDYSVAAYPEDFYRRLRQVAIATKEGCEKRELLIHVLQSDKLTESLKSPYWEPSFEYEETLGDDGEDGFYVWHRKKFGVEKVCFDYIRKIGPIACPELEDCGSYVNEEGEKVDTNLDFEIDATYFWRRVVDVAVLMAKRDVDDVTNYQTELQMIVFKTGQGQQK